MKKQNVRTLALIVCTFTYLLVGAAIFDVLESDNERKEREALQEVESMIFKKYNFTKDDYAFMELVVLQTIPHRAGQQWKFAGAFYYATTVLTTIGYGHSTPNTVSGKLFTMLYATIGIPLGLVMFQSIGERLNKCSSIIIKQVKKMAKKSQVQATEINLIFVVITLSILIIVAGAAVFSRYEDWSYFDATYYCFVTLTTIGFGDYVALQNNDALASQPEYVAFSLIFILFGLTVVAASVNLLVLRFVTMNTVDERKDEMEARQAAQGAVRLEGDVITTNGSIISGHFGRSERGPGGSGAVGLGVGPGGGMDHRILSSLSLSDIASVCGDCGGMLRPFSCWPASQKASKPPHLRYNRHNVHLHAHHHPHFMTSGGSHLKPPGFLVPGSSSGRHAHQSQIRLKTFRITSHAGDDDDDVFDTYARGVSGARISTRQSRRRNFADDEDDSSFGRLEVSSQPRKPRAWLDSDEHSFYDEEYYAPLPDDFSAPDGKRMSI